jgi:hypothetical protein
MIEDDDSFCSWKRYSMQSSKANYQDINLKKLGSFFPIKKKNITL